MKRHIPVTLACVDTTPKVCLAERAIRKCLELATFDEVKLLTNDKTREHAVEIPTLANLEAYSTFIIRELHRHINTRYCLLIQSDGYMINPESWTDAFFQYDFIGATWSTSRMVGNGGFSLRSKKFLEATAKFRPEENCHPEDAWATMKHREELIRLFGIRFPPPGIADVFAFEGRKWDGSEWNGVQQRWNNAFGFHSWLTVLPDEIDKPVIFHHSGDAGDVIYGLAVMKAMGGGVLFLSPDNHYPYPRNTRWIQSGGRFDWVANLAPLLESQDYVWSVKYTHKLPFSCSVDMNRFREFYRGTNPYNWRSLFDLHQLACGTSWSEKRPWIRIEEPITIPDRPIVVNRTARYHNDRFPWAQFTREHGGKMVFVGTEEEYKQFWWEYKCPQVIHRPTGNMLDVARIVAGGKMFMGNQSSPLAIALAVGQNVMVETWAGNANCMLKRDNAIHWQKQRVPFPHQWLR